MNFTDEIKIVGLKRFGDFLAIVRPSYAFMKAQDKKLYGPGLPVQNFHNRVKSIVKLHLNLPIFS